MTSRALLLPLAVMCVLAWPRAGVAQLPADAVWHTIESPRFRVTYEAGLESLARHAAASAERAHDALQVLVAQAPHGRIDIVIADHVDWSNGYATPFPTNRIVIYAKPPVDVLELQYTRDWIELVVTHELAHIFHLDVTSGLGRLARTIFGRAPLPWPVFPAVGVPRWNIEGLAVGVESEVATLGRVHGSHHDMVVRTAALGDRFDELDRLESGSARWPGPARVYIYGSLFMDYVARRHGADAVAGIVRSTAGAIIPPPLWFNGVGSSALGTSFREAYREWQREVIAHSDSVARIVSAQGLTTGTRLSAHGAVAQYPRFSPDGTRIVYAAHDWRTPSEFRVIDAATGERLRSERLNLPSPVTWVTDDRVITSDVDFVDRFRAFGDLHLVGPGGRRLTHRQRLQDPDASRHGRIIAVQNAAGTNRLVLVDTASGEVRSLTEYDPDTHWSLPRFSPGGDHIAAARWQTGGAWDIVVLDTVGDVESIAAGPGINTAPVWSADGRWLLFSSDRTGITNIYAIAAVSPSGSAARADVQLRQVTNVLTGAFQPDVSPDGRWIAYAAYADDGFHIERLPFDTTHWRAPQPAGLTEQFAPRHATSAATVTSADTVTSVPRPYSPLRSLRPHFWLPSVATGVVDDAIFLGFSTYGEDLIGRHAWRMSLAAEPGRGRTRGGFQYSLRGLPEIASIGLHPTVSVAVNRDWEVYIPAPAPGEPYVDQREDVAALTLDLVRARWRSTSGLTLAAERFRRSRTLYDAPADVRLLDPEDDMWGARFGAYTARSVQPPLSISRENGYSVQLYGRQRWERHVRTLETDNGTRTFDGSYRELTSWNTAYVALPLPGFARHVIAARFSGLLRDGPGASISRVGGAGASGLTIPGVVSGLGGVSTLLPVRGFDRGARFGSNAWTASLEYRAPILFVDSPLRALFIDRISAAAFIDAGHGWCSTDVAARFAACTSTSAAAASLVGTGIEATVRAGLLGLRADVRAGAAMPLRGADDTSPRFHLLLGPSF